MLACWRSSWHRYSIRSNSCPKKLAAPQEQRTAPHTTALPPLLTMTLLTSVSCPPSSNPNRPQFRDSRTNKRFPRSSYCLSNSCLLSSRLRSSPIGEGLWFMRRETSKRVRVRALCGTSLRWIAAEPQPNRSRTAAEPQQQKKQTKAHPTATLFASLRSQWASTAGLNSVQGEQENSRTRQIKGYSTTGPDSGIPTFYLNHINTYLLSFKRPASIEIYPKNSTRKVYWP